MTTERVRAIQIQTGPGGASGAVRKDNAPRAMAEERLTAEAPLQIRVNKLPFTTTMRTPGDDRRLARGLLLTEGVISDPAAPVTWGEERDPAAPDVILTVDARAPEAFVAAHRLGRRSLMGTSSCGLCGTVEARDVRLEGPPLQRLAEEKLDARLIPAMLAAMRAGQRVFGESGGSHAAAAFTLAGEALAVGEDVGRHNAVDKVIGALIEAGALNSLAVQSEIEASAAAKDGASHIQTINALAKSEIAQVLLVSGRVSFEIVSKAYRAGLPFVLGVSATTTMAAAEAERLGITLLAFCREDRATVYSRAEFVTNGTAKE